MLRSQAPRRLPIAPPEAPPKIDFRSPRTAGYIDAALGPGGHLARALPGWESRPGQLLMARAVDAAIADGKHLMVEAPCGSGKGVAYLVPAIEHAVGRGKRVVVATATIALQEQLIRSDLPLLRSTLPTAFTFAIAKGKNNYLCIERFEEEDASGVRDPRWREVRAWAAVTQTGDVSELPFEPGPLRQRFTTSAEDCLGRQCPKHEDCHAEAAKRAYSAADVIVTNDHLFLIDLVIKQADPEKGPLPAWAVAVVDEGHRLADISRDLLGWKVTRGMVDAVAKLLAPASDERVDQDLADDLTAEAKDYFAELLQHRRSDRYKARLRAAGEVGGDHLASLLRAAGSALEGAAEFAEGKRAHRLKVGGARANMIAMQLNAASELTNAERRVYCVEVDGEEGDRAPRAALVCKLIWPADFLRPKLFDVPGRSVVLTSATLAVAGSFDFPAHELGCESARELQVPTPFDFARQAVLVVPRGGPDPKKRDEHERWCAEQIVEVAAMARGRTLALFSSWRGLRRAREAFDAVDPRMRALWGSVLVQGDAPRGQLIARFKSEMASVLLGVESFWEGIDVPGEALSVVVIDRLPFATPDDPVLDAVDELLPRGAFEEWSLPRAVTAIRQGQGRLIRSQTDRGVVVILDDRIVTKGYGKRFLRSLPPMPLSRRVEDVGAFLAGEKIPT